MSLVVAFACSFCGAVTEGIPFGARDEELCQECWFDQGNNAEETRQWQEACGGLCIIPTPKCEEEAAVVEGLRERLVPRRKRRRRP